MVATETDAERCGSIQLVWRKEHQISRPLRAGNFEFHVQEKRGFSAASFLPINLSVVRNLKGAGAQAACSISAKTRDSSEPAWAARQKSPARDSPRDCPTGLRSGISECVPASGETTGRRKRMIGVTQVLATAGTIAACGLGYSPLGNLWGNERKRDGREYCICRLVASR
jgi:hypothetical protein